jgi:negative regulator of sigma F NrsF-like protein
LSDLSHLDEIPDPVSPGAHERPPGERLRGQRLPVPTRVVAERRRMAALGVSLAWLCAHLVVYGIRQDFAQLPPAYIAAQIILPFVFGGCCLVVALAPGRLGLGLGVGLISAMAWLGPLAFWLLALGVPVPYLADPGQLGFWLGACLCLGITLACAAAPLLLVALSLRRAFPTHALGRSALVGAALGLLSGGVINLHCSNVDPWHLFAAHGVPVAVAALIGAVLVVRFTRV